MQVVHAHHEYMTRVSKTYHEFGHEQQQIIVYPTDSHQLHPYLPESVLVHA